MFCFWGFCLALDCWIDFVLGARGKTGAWAPDLVAGEEGKQEATNAAFSPCWGEQLGWCAFAHLAGAAPGLRNPEPAPNFGAEVQIWRSRFRLETTEPGSKKTEPGSIGS